MRSSINKTDLARYKTSFYTEKHEILPRSPAGCKAEWHALKSETPLSACWVSMKIQKDSGSKIPPHHFYINTKIIQKPTELLPSDKSSFCRRYHEDFPLLPPCVWTLTAVFLQPPHFQPPAHKHKPLSFFPLNSIFLAGLLYPLFLFFSHTSHPFTPALSLSPSLLCLHDTIGEYCSMPLWSSLDRNRNV